jgi:tetratricopeptide (TPR) repeat protein
MQLEIENLNIANASSPEADPLLDLAFTAFSQAKALYQLTSFSESLVGFRQVVSVAQRTQNQQLEVECLIYMTRIYLEQEKREELLGCTMQLHRLRSQADLPPAIQAKIHYVLGVLTYAEPDRKMEALQSFQKSIEICLQINDRESLCYAVYGVANVYYGLNEYDRCLEELDKLSEILKFNPVPDVHVFCLLLRSFIDRNRLQTERALRWLKEACEHLRTHPNMYLYLQSLYALGTTYMKAGDFNSAQIYLELGKITCSPKEMPRLHSILLKSWNECRTESATKPAREVSFDISTGMVVRAGRGSISLQGQFVLREMLALFLDNPGVIFSKEELVEKIWKEEYSPLVHDNKIYVTLKRLRQALQPLFPEVDAILRSRNGYSFNHRLFTLTLTGSGSEKT